MATKMEKSVIVADAIYDMRIELLDSGKEFYTKTEILDFFDGFVREIKIHKK